MMRKELYAVAVTVVLLTSALHASRAAAQTQQQIDWCNNSDNAFSVDQQLVGCTALVESERASAQDRAAGYTTAAGRIPTKAIRIGRLPIVTKRSGSIPN
jgi:hypothetical protein